MKRLDRRAISYWTLKRFFVTMIIILLVGMNFHDLILYFGSGGIFKFLIGLLLSIPIVVVLAYISAKISWSNFEYDLTDSEFKQESGIIHRSSIFIPYDRIQTVDIERGIFARLFGISDIIITTAGVGESRWNQRAGIGRLPGISQDEAMALRIEIMSRARQAKSSGL